MGSHKSLANTFVPRAIYKVPSGKLLKVFLEIEEGRIQKIKITGDFFMYPEEKIEELESMLRGAELNGEKLHLSIQAFKEKEELELFGVDVESLVKVILMCNPSGS